MAPVAPAGSGEPVAQWFQPDFENGGRGGIRTHGELPHVRFRVECLKPGSATLPFDSQRLVQHPKFGNCIFYGPVLRFAVNLHFHEHKQAEATRMDFRKNAGFV